MITVSYQLHGTTYDHLRFRYWRICKAYVEALIRRGATDVRIQG